MELIITKEFLDNFFIAFDEGNKCHVDFEDFLTKKIRDVTIIIDMEDWTEWQKASTDNVLWEKLLDIPKMTPEFVPTIEDDMCSAEFYSNYTYPYKMFFASKDKNECDNLSKNFGFEFLCIENLDEKWETYYSQREDLHLPIDSKSSQRFDNWSKLSNFKHPINSAVIIDNYLFCEFKRNGVKQFSHANNLFEILRHLLENNSNQIDLQITIITASQNINIDDAFQPSSYSDRMRFIKTKIEDFIRSEVPLLSFDISIINYDKKIHSTEREHDRGVYTNYFYFEVGTGLNVFDCTNSIINRSKISIYSPIRSVEKNLTLSGLRNIKTYINDLSNYLSSNPLISRDRYISGSGFNRLLNGI
jgi:hypothetical protein